MSMWSRVLNLVRQRRVDRELDDEQRFHLESRIDDLIRGGLTRDQATSQAARRFGGRLHTRESSREIKLLPWLESLVRDTRHGLRLLRRDAIVSGAAAVSLALALGACAAAFSLVDALMLRPLPVRDPQRLIYLTYRTGSTASSTTESFSHPAFERLRDASAGVELMFVSYAQPRRGHLPGGDDPREEFSVQFLSGNAFGMLGVRAAIGRLLGPSDATSGSTPVAVLDHRYWLRRFGADPSIVGRSITIDDRRVEIVGVADGRFFGVEPGSRPNVWLPATLYDPRAFTSPNWHWIRILGRLAPGVDPVAAQSALQPAFRAMRAELAARLPPERSRESVRRFIETPLGVASAASGPSGLRRQFGRPLMVLCAVAGLVLLIAASNVTNLLLARGAARSRERSMRLSLGASRLRLLQHSIIESALLACLASGLALIFARVSAPIIVTLLAPATEPAFLDLRTDWRLVAFIVVLTMAVTMLVGAGPALRASQSAPLGAIGQSGGRATTRNGLWRPLVAAQMAFSLCVLFVASLLLLSFVRLTRVDLGFNPHRILLVTVDAPALKEPDAKDAAAASLLDRVRSLAGVESASLSAWPLFSQGGWTDQPLIPGRPADQGEIVHLPVSPGFFATMGMPILNGRDFALRDRSETGVLPIVVNEAFVRRYFHGGPALGRIVERRSSDGMVRQEVVGVVGNATYNDPRAAPAPSVYVPLRGFGSLQIRTSGAPLTLVDAVRRAVGETHPALVVNQVALQSTMIDDALLRERLLALLSGFFATAGLVLTAVGVYGVLSYAVIRRTREIGVRLALGARRASIVGSVLRDVTAVTAIGVAAGLASGVLLARYVASLLFEVAPLDPASLVLPVAALLAAAALAAIAPALRATRVDPIIALRTE
jgi:putative ABC transport system permease protein